MNTLSPGLLRADETVQRTSAVSYRLYQRDAELVAFSSARRIAST
jgi:hypothetical protein